MSYTTGTTNYNLPQYVGTDKPSWTDTNEPFAAIDTAIGGATESITTMGNRVTTLEGQVNDASTGILARLSAAESDIDTVEGGVSSLNTAVNGLTTEVADVRTDTEDMICAYKEESATSTHAYEIGDYFIYNDVLYKATLAISIGATIVPNTNCTATNITSEIKKFEESEIKVHITATETYGDVISKILNHSGYDSSKLKGGSYIEFVSNGVIYEFAGTGSFDRTYCYSTLRLNTNEINLNNRTYIHCESTSSGTTLADQTSSVFGTETDIILHY